MTRIGLIGMGYIGRHVYQRMRDDPRLGLDVAFVHNRSRDAVRDVPAALVLNELDDFASRTADLVVEMSHPSVTRRYGPSILKQADYLALSVSALADAELLDRLESVATASGTRLYVPHGALVGADSLVEYRESWAEVSITFRKHPRNIDFTESGVDPAVIDGETVLYDGSVRGIAAKYPRNVNTMVTCALATVGLDRCRGILIADPTLDVAVAEVRAIGHAGEILETTRRQPILGVSGNEMIESMFFSIVRAAGATPGVVFV